MYIPKPDIFSEYMEYLFVTGELDEEEEEDFESEEEEDLN